MNEASVSDRGLVAAPHLAAAEAGRAILGEGGNAVEAMIAMAATIAVVYPHMAALGGDGFWMVREPDGRVHYIEACGPAGSGATIAAYNARGHGVVPARGGDAAVTVAGAVGGFALAMELARAGGGRLPLDILFDAAIGHAREGVSAPPHMGGLKPKLPEKLHAVPGFLQAFGVEGRDISAGERLVQPALAAMLDQLVHAGLDDFYRGDIGREIAVDLEHAGSPITRADLTRYAARTRKPLAIDIGAGTFYNSPPPTQGLSALQILALVDRLPKAERESTGFVHQIVEATKRAFIIRDRAITDPAFMDEKARDLLDGPLLDRLAGRIAPDRALPWPAPADDLGDTVWMGAIDGKGRAVSYIQSIYWEWGSGVVLPRTGLLWQNRGASFSLDPAARNPLMPGRLPFHTLNPPLAVMRDGRVLAFGTMGGEGQPQTNAAIALRHLVHDAGVAEAIDLPRWRLGRSWGETETTLKIEPRFDDRVYDDLARMGHEVDVTDEPYAQEMGHAGMILREVSGRITGAHDPRADGGAAAP